MTDLPGAPDADRDIPTYIDPTVPSTARVYDAGLGGKDNFEVDREMLRKVQAVAPEITQLALASRAFLVRACRFLARDAKVANFLDCGSGLPTADNVHQVVQRYNPGASVVYVDNDPIVVGHGRALLSENDLTHFTARDIFDPATLLRDDTVRAELDWSGPICLIHSMTMHFCQDDPTPIMQEYIANLPSGSFVVFSHAFDPQNEYQETIRKVEHASAGASAGQVHFRTRDELKAMLAGLELLDPGLVCPADWWPEGPQQGPPVPIERCIVSAIGRKP